MKKSTKCWEKQLGELPLEFWRDEEIKEWLRDIGFYDFWRRHANIPSPPKQGELKPGRIF